MNFSDTRSIGLRWSGDALVFMGSTGDGAEIAIDGDSSQGPSPMELLLLSLTGCMAIDLRMILEKSRVPVESLEIDAAGERASEAPKKYELIRIVCRITGPGEEHESQVQRALDLSRDKYCSVLHSLNPEISMDIRIEHT
jgi:putative redox protein